MTNEELQTAIDKTLAMVMSTEGGHKHDSFRETAYAHLKELFKIQAVRAGLPSYPTVKIQEALDKKADNARELGLSYD